MKTKIKIEKEVDLKTLKVNAGVRYWEDGDVDGIEDTIGSLIPCRDRNRWKLNIDIDTGKITNWRQGVKAKVHYKVCDDGIYQVFDEDGVCCGEVDGYVIGCLSIGKSGYGDYIILNIDENGIIEGFKFDYSDFEDED